MAESIVSSIVFWSMGYGAVMGFALAPVLILEASSWCMRLAIVGFTVPVCSLVTTAFVMSFYVYGHLVLTISNIITQPLFMVSMIQTFALSATMYSAFLIFKKMQLLDEENKSNEESEEECEANEESEEECEANEESEEECEANEESESSEEESEESDETKESDEKEEENKKSENEWRKTANFEGIRNASPLPE